MGITPEERYGLSRRRFLQLSGFAAGGLLLGACGPGDGGAVQTTTTTTVPGTTTTTAGTTTTTAGEAPAAVPQSPLATVNLDFNTPNINLQAPFWVGQTLGFFEEVGITTLNVTQSDDPVIPVVAGSVHVALLDSILLFNAEHVSHTQGEPLGLTYTCCVFGGQPLVFVAREGITAEDLGGKIVGAAREGSVNEALARFMVSELGYDPDADVDLRSMTGGSNDWVTALLTGQIDATIAFPRHIPIVEAEGGSVLYQGTRPEPQNGFGILRSVLDENPDFATAWIYAYIKAQRWCKDPDNWEEMRRIIVEDQGLDYPDNAWQVREIDAELLTQDMGWNPDQMDEHLAFVAPFAGVTEELPWRDYTDVTYLHQAQEALGLDTNPSADLTTGENLTADL